MPISTIPADPPHEPDVPSSPESSHVPSNRPLVTLGIIALVFGVCLSLFSVSQMFKDLSSPSAGGAKCGNVFTSSDDWTFASREPHIDFGDFMDNRQRAMTDAVEDVMDNLRVGAAAFDECQRLHNTQWTLIAFTGVPGLLLLGAGITGIVLGRKSPRPRMPVQRPQPRQ